MKNNTVKKNKNVGTIIGGLVGLTSVNLLCCFLYFVFTDIYFWNQGLYIGIYNNLPTAIAGGQAFDWASGSYAKMLLFSTIISALVLMFHYFSLSKYKYHSLINMAIIPVLILIIFSFMQWKIGITSALIIFAVCLIVIIGVPGYFLTRFVVNKYNISNQKLAKL